MGPLEPLPRPIKGDLKDRFPYGLENSGRDLLNLIETFDTNSLWEIVVEIFRVWNNGETIWTMGNGGSAATASHFAEDLGLASVDAISLCADAPRLTALANDFGYETVFWKQLEILAKPGDMVFILSVSGNSQNVVEAAKWARGNSLSTAGFLGKDGGKVKEFLHAPLVIPSDDFGLVESVHLFLCHVISQFIHSLR